MAARRGSEGADADDDAPARTAAPPGRLRLLPSSLLGLASLVFFMGIASAFTGAVLYAYYESKLEQQEQDLDAFISGFTDTVEGARATIQSEGDAARTQIDDQLSELQQFSAGGSTLTALLDGASPSVWFVSTLDDTGAPSVGSAFVVFSDPEQSFLLTSYEVVRAATAEPAPDITVRNGDRELPASVFTWDEGRDLALLTLPLGSEPPLAFVAEPNAIDTGDRVFAISGLGSDGASVAQGFVTDAAADAIQHDTPIGAAFRGGPLLASDGTVIGVSSRRYAPLGFDPLAVFFAPPIRLACEVVITCPDGSAAPPG